MKNWEPINIDWTEDLQDKGTKFLLFLISPIVSLIYSFKNLASKSSYNILFLFCTLFGLAFTVSATRSDFSIDGISYRIMFEQWTYSSLSDYIDGFKDYISFETGTRDFYVETVCFLVSRVTRNYHLFFMTLAAIFAYFQLKTLRYLTSHKYFDNGIVCLILVFFFLWNQIFNINGCRFWTASWVAVYSVFQIFGNDKKKYLFLALLTPFVHGSFWSFVIVVTLAFFTRYSQRLWKILFILSFIFSSVSITILQNVSDLLPPFMYNFVDYYTSEENLTRFDTYQGWRTWFSYIVKLYPSVLIIMMSYAKNKEESDSSTSMFGFLLILATFANFTMSIPTLGARFMVLTYPLICYCWLSFFSTYRLKLFIYAIPFLWFAEIYDIIHLYLLVVEPLSLFLTPIYSLIKFL